MLKKSLKYLLIKNGLYRPDVAVDFRGLTDDPLDAMERAGVNSCLIEASLDLCRSFGPLGFGCTSGSLNPFVQSLLELRDGQHSGNQKSALQKYYDSFQPKNVAEVFGFEDPVQASLALPPNTYAYPWEGYPKKGLLKKRMKRYKRNSISDTLLNDQHFGPQSERNIAQHLNRLTFLRDRFSSNPYESRDYLHDEIIAQLFVHDGRYAFRIRNGHHRVAALSALGYERVEVRIDRDNVYRRDDLNNWEGVVKGKFTEEQALEIFDQIFIGETHPFARRMKEEDQIRQFPESRP